MRMVGSWGLHDEVFMMNHDEAFLFFLDEHKLSHESFGNIKFKESLMLRIWSNSLSHFRL